MVRKHGHKSCAKKYTFQAKPYQFAVTDHLVFTALHEMQTWSSDEKAVCLSIKSMDCDKTAERSVQIFIPYERLFSL